MMTAIATEPAQAKEEPGVVFHAEFTFAEAKSRSQEFTDREPDKDKQVLNQNRIWVRNQTFGMAEEVLGYTPTRVKVRYEFY